MRTGRTEKHLGTSSVSGRWWRRRHRSWFAPPAPGPRTHRSTDTREAWHGLESLEPRLLLSATILDAQRGAIMAGLDQLATWSAAAEVHGELGQAVGLIETALGSTADLDNTVSQKLIEPLFGADGALNDPNATVTDNDVVAALTAVAGVNAGGAFDANELRFDVSLDVQNTAPDLPLSLGPAAAALGLDIDANTAAFVDLQSTLRWDLSFGVDLTDGSVDQDDFFVRTSGFSLSSAIDEADMAFTLNIGLLDGTVTDGEFQLNADFDVVLNDADLSFAELQGADLAALLAINAAGDLAASFPVDVDFLPFSDGSDPAVQIEDLDLFDTTAPVLTKQAFDSVDQSNAAVAQALTDGLAALFDLTQQMSDTGALGTSIALIGGTVGEHLDPAGILADQLAQPVADFFASSAGAATFDDLVAELGSLSATAGDLTFTVHAATGQRVGDELQIDLDISAGRSETGVTLDLATQLSDLITADVAADLTSTMQWQFQVGVALDQLPSSADAFFGRFQPLAIAADLAIPNAVFDARAGFLELAVGTHNGNQSGIVLDADVQVNLLDTDASGRVTMAEFQGAMLDDVADQSGTALLDIELYALSQSSSPESIDLTA